MSHSLEQILGDSESRRSSRLSARVPDGKLPLTPKMLREEPSGVWRGAIYDVDRIIEVINAGLSVEHKT
jgi:hypothetical protein